MVTIMTTTRSAMGKLQALKGLIRMALDDLHSGEREGGSETEYLLEDIQTNLEQLEELMDGEALGVAQNKEE